jgi:predicted AlkP superfamily pyrophosphatase or phosphodiesterase
MILRSGNFYLLLLFASVISSFVFCVGFFPYAVVNVGKNIEKNPTRTEFESQVDRSILMVIDAFRLDFLESESFSYINELISKKEGCSLRLKVSLPTVTKPRIKVVAFKLKVSYQLFNKMCVYRR